MKKTLLLLALLAPGVAHAQIDLIRLGVNMAMMANNIADISAQVAAPEALDWQPQNATAATRADTQRAQRKAAQRGIPQLTTRLARHPDSAALLLVRRGRLYEQTGDGDHAVADLLQAQKKGTTDPHFNLYLAQANLRRRQLPTARIYATQQVEQTPAEAAPYLLRAIITLHEGARLPEPERFAPAQADLKKAVAVDSTYHAARLLRGYAYFEQNALPAAARDFEYLLALAPASDELHFHLGRTYAEMGNLIKACPHLQAGAAFNPTATRRLLKEYCP